MWYGITCPLYVYAYLLEGLPACIRGGLVTRLGLTRVRMPWPCSIAPHCTSPCPSYPFPIPSIPDHLRLSVTGFGNHNAQLHRPHHPTTPMCLKHTSYTYACMCSLCTTRLPLAALCQACVDVHASRLQIIPLHLHIH